MELNYRELKLLQELVQASLEGEGANKNRIRKNTVLRKIKKMIADSSKND